MNALDGASFVVGTPLPGVFNTLASTSRRLATVLVVDQLDLEVAAGHGVVVPMATDRFALRLQITHAV
jgi:hypothetical protein